MQGMVTRRRLPFEYKKTLGGLGWQLVCRSLVKALLQLLFETKYRYEESDIETEALDNRLNVALEQHDYYLHPDFFEHPENLPFLDHVTPVLKDFLGCFGLKQDEITNILIRFKTFFVLALRTEWVDNNDSYKSLEEIIKTPFDPAIKRNIEWEKYFITLEKQIADPVFNECFCLEQIYIPLRACYKQQQPKPHHENAERTDIDELQKEEKEVKEVIVNIDNHIANWINKGNKQDGIRIIHGGPGSGKSSFLKMLAAKLARQKQKTLYIPLHLYDVKADFTIAVNQFFRKTGYFTYDLINDDQTDSLVILFDGLDELSMQGRVLEEIANDFVRDVIKNVPILNTNRLRIQVIIAGRDVIVQRNEKEFRNPGEVLRILPYLIQEEEEKFIDTLGLYKNDQRYKWWTKYGELKNNPYNGLPDVLKEKENEIIEITAQPLLNYLIALALEYKGDDDTPIIFKNLNNIYARLLKGVFNREYGAKPITQGLTFDDFVYVLKEIALSAWHGKGRTTTVDEIKKYIKNEALLKTFSSSAEKGVISLLTTFYFRQTGNYIKDAETFEFTHKSFGEYLVSLKIIETLDRIHNQFTLNEKDRAHEDGWNVYQCLVKWLEVFGLQAPDADLVKYIEKELILKEQSNTGILEKWQDTIVKLLDHVLEKGMPVEQLPLRPQTFKEENEQALKAEKSLLIMHGLIARNTDKASAIQWPQETSFGEFIGRLTDQRTSPYVFILKFCNHLVIKDAILHIKDLYKANFSKSVLIKAQLYLSNLRVADLSEANLSEADLSVADLSEADLSEADLCGANLSGADLSGANLSGAVIYDADLSRADLRRANFSGANLRGADLRGTDLRGADLSEADLRRADLRNCRGFDRKTAQKMSCRFDDYTKWD